MSNNRTPYNWHQKLQLTEQQSHARALQEAAIRRIAAQQQPIVQRTQNV